jgi:hypothetical protein
MSEEYRGCMSKGLKGKTGLTKEQRKLVFCETSQVCSGKAGSAEEARKHCEISITEKKNAPPKTRQRKESNTCSDLLPVLDWLQQPERPDHCPPCLITPLAENYLGALNKKAPEAAAKLMSAWETGDALTIADTMDKIKVEVGDDLRNRLKSLDCQAQSFKASA